MTATSINLMNPFRVSEISDGALPCCKLAGVLFSKGSNPLTNLTEESFFRSLIPEQPESAKTSASQSHLRIRGDLSGGSERKISSKRFCQ